MEKWMYGGSSASIAYQINSLKDLTEKEKELDDGSERRSTDKDKDNTDKGWAWVVMTASCLSLMIVNGVAYTSGIYNVAFLEEFGESKATTAWIGSLINSTSCTAAVFSSLITNRFSCRTSLILAGLVSSAGCVLSYFATSVHFLIVTYGLITGAGLGMAYTPALVIVGHYFDKRLVLATGVATVGGGLGVFLLAPLMQFLTDVLTWRGAMLITAGLCLNLLVCGGVMRPLSLYKHNKQNPEPILNCRVLFNIKYVILSASAFLWAAGIGVVYVHLAAYAISKGTQPMQASLLFSVTGISNLIFKFFTGMAANGPEIDRQTIYLGSLGILGLVTVCGPLFMNGYIGQIFYATAFGMYLAGPLVLFAPLTVQYVDVKNFASALGMLMLGKGVGYIIGPVIAGWLFDLTDSYENSFYFAGACFLLSSSIMLVAPVVDGHLKDNDISESVDITCKSDSTKSYSTEEPYDIIDELAKMPS